jgi:ferredoxin
MSPGTAPVPALEPIRPDTLLRLAPHFEAAAVSATDVLVRSVAGTELLTDVTLAELRDLAPRLISPVTLDSLTRELLLPPDRLRAVLNALRQAGALGVRFQPPVPGLQGAGEQNFQFHSPFAGNAREPSVLDSFEFQFTSPLLLANGVLGSLVHKAVASALPRTRMLWVTGRDFEDPERGAPDLLCCDTVERPAPAAPAGVDAITLAQLLAAGSPALPGAVAATDVIIAALEDVPYAALSRLAELSTARRIPFYCVTATGHRVEVGPCVIHVDQCNLEFSKLPPKVVERPPQVARVGAMLGALAGFRTHRIEDAFGETSARSAARALAAEFMRAQTASARVVTHTGNVARERWLPGGTIHHYRLRQAARPIWQGRGPQRPAWFTEELRALVEEELRPLGLPFELGVVRPSEIIQLRTRPFYAENPQFGEEGFSLNYDDIAHLASIVVITLFTDVAVDYYVVHQLVPKVMARVNERFGRQVCHYDNYGLLRKELAVIARLGTIGRNALFFSRRFGFNCKIDLFLSDVEFDEYKTLPREHWRLGSCESCDVCVSACPVSAYKDFTMLNASACDKHISPKWDTPDEMCRKCVTSCPPSQVVLQRLYDKGVPQQRRLDSGGVSELQAYAAVARKQRDSAPGH